MRKRLFIILCLLTLAVETAFNCYAGLIGPGKYCGVVIFDRWDACILHHGAYVMYISEKIKEKLRQYKGQCIQIDSKEVLQVMNPGDAIIKDLEYLGPALDPRRKYRMNRKSKAPLRNALEMLKLTSSIRVGKNSKAIAIIKIENTGKKDVELFRRGVSITLLKKIDTAIEKRKGFSPSDGPSYVWTSRTSLEKSPSSKENPNPRLQSKLWSVNENKTFPYSFVLAPGEKKQIEIKFELPDSEYDFLFGYSYNGIPFREKSLASNLSAFDIKDGKARLVNISGRKLPDSKKKD